MRGQSYLSTGKLEWGKDIMATRMRGCWRNEGRGYGNELEKWRVLHLEMLNELFGKGVGCDGYLA
jgi:hypothetical protein